MQCMMNRQSISAFAFLPSVPGRPPQPGLSSIPAMQQIRDFPGREPVSAALIERYSQHTP